MDIIHITPLRHGSPLITEAALCTWIGQASTGDRIAYHRGFLAWDIAPEMQMLPGRARAELARVASRARNLAQAGAVHLVQRREGPADYTYLIIVRLRPRQARSQALQQLLEAGQDTAPTTLRHRRAA